ncbi:phosphonate degradation HD-domain oxygenase [Aquirufa echingensis]|mgnify:FL=1|jgi:phosphonate degradation associated HDIG domain protein|uniref:Phosphonate degradation HD-domain oxygenase n=1 Tax=Aquirufa echingensis TaxID=3096516 RepID=A0ABW6D1E1_9BACT
MNTLIEKIENLFLKAGDSEYGGESVTQGEHALQAAFLAKSEGYDAHLIVACLLHDVGHMLHALPDDAPEQGIDDLHEELGFRFLEKYFIDAVAEPVRLHVDAKRYLCAKEPEYFGQLSEPSLISLALQGGPMSAIECQAFESNPFYREAVQLRRIDDLAKIPNLEVDPISSYGEMLKISAK